jgi:hypothetical protein
MEYSKHEIIMKIKVPVASNIEENPPDSNQTLCRASWLNTGKEETTSDNFIQLVLTPTNNN